MIARGDIRWYRFSSPEERRPVLVLGRAEIMQAFTQVSVIPLSTDVRGLRWEVALSESDGVPSACVLKPEWIRSVDKKSLGPLIARFDEHRWRELRRALVDVLGFG
ncbi:MAG: type II toxin-antitoxin system PemK/MazF family toxin [Polyangiaceae bacterium]